MVEALEPALDPAAARLEHDHLEVAEALEDAREDEVREGYHRVDGKACRGGVADVGEVEAERRPRHVPHGERVEADGDPQRGRRLPERVVAAVIEVAAAVRVRADEDAAEAELAHAAARLGDRGLDVDHGDGADADQALGGRGAVVVQPVVVRAAEAPGDLGRRVADREADGRVEDGDVDPLRVHVREARAAVEGARGAALVAYLAAAHAGSPTTAPPTS